MDLGVQYYHQKSWLMKSDVAWHRGSRHLWPVSIGSPTETRLMFIIGFKAFLM